jgi:type I restriction enzyme R subunit
MKHTSEAAFETAIGTVFLKFVYGKLASSAFDIERAIFPDKVLAFIRLMGLRP